MDDIAARYRIQAVSQMTGVSTATLRAWERRYGFPAPGRSASAYRLYSQRDVDLVRRMQALLEQGLSPSEAARQLLGETPPPEAIATTDDPYALAVQRLLAAVESLDATALQIELRRALLLDSGVVAFQRILRPALVEIGELWHAGKISVASEHFASHMIASVLLDLVRLTPIPPDAPRALLACFPEEQHVIPLYGAGLELASWGYRPVVLGARTPASAIARALEAIKPAIVGLSVTITPGSAGHVREIVDAYADACRDIPWVVGGAAAAAMTPFVEARGGHVLPADSDGARRLVDQVVAASVAGGRRARPAPASPPGAKLPRAPRVPGQKRSKQGRA
jgi:DNA-binding transcriptional MerR regulator